MTFENVQFSRVVRAVAITFVVGTVLSFLASCLIVPLWPQDLSDRLTDSLERFSDADSDPEVLQQDFESITEDYQTEITLNYFLQWALVTGLTFLVARQTASFAVTPQQATGYGVAVGVGVAVTYGLLCVMCSIAFLLLRLLFIGLFVGAGALGGQVAAQNLDPEKARQLATRQTRPRRDVRGTWPQPGAFGPSSGSPVPPGANPDVYYNMGVTAAMGGRPQEARQHFTRVLQMQPRNIAAWLQLANLADTPEQAWEYIQQARAVNPNDPAVMEAVDVIWPQVAARASSEGEVPCVQPPYRGAEMPQERVLPASPPDQIFTEGETLADMVADDETPPPDIPEPGEPDAGESGPDDDHADPPG
jgi:tetratricopeptide (TPR) repeat protein